VILDVNVTRNEATGQMIIIPLEPSAVDQLTNATKLGGFFLNSSDNTFQIKVTTSTLLPPGTYEYKLYALTANNDYTDYFYYSITIEETPNPENSMTNPANNAATVTFSSHQDSAVQTAYFGSATVAGSAYYDTNENGYLDNCNAPTPVPFPGFPDATGNIYFGCGYANVNGVKANLIVVAELGNGKRVAIHFRVANDTITPIQTMVGDFANGPILIQEQDFIFPGLDGQLPTANSNGYFYGEMTLNPFFFDGLDNIIYGNEVAITFSMALVSDN